MVSYRQYIEPARCLPINCSHDHRPFPVVHRPRASSNFLQSCTPWWSLILAWVSAITALCASTENSSSPLMDCILSSLFLLLIGSVKLYWLYWVLHSQPSLVCRQGEQDLLLLRGAFSEHCGPGFWLIVSHSGVKASVQLGTTVHLIPHENTVILTTWEQLTYR